MSEDLVTLKEAAALARMTPTWFRQLALRGKVRRFPSLGRGAGYSRAEAEALGKHRAETLELTGKPGQPRRRREGASA